MPRGTELDSDALWRRAGLGELRASLVRVTELTRAFEGQLRQLPPCEQCAQARLLGEIGSAGRRLGREAVTVSMVAELLTEASSTAQETQERLLAEAPSPCRCDTGPCTCHE